MKIALVHDYLTQRGGAERVFELLCRHYPNADIFTSLYHPPSTIDLGDRMVQTTFLQSVPQAAKYFRLLTPFYYPAFRSLNLQGYDLIISSSSSFAKSVRKSAGVKHICFCHNVTRFLWDTQTYLKEYKEFLKFYPIIARIFKSLREIDLAYAQEPDLYIANSSIVANRIQSIYKKRVVTVNYPVDVQKFQFSEQKSDYYLVICRLLSYKRIDLIVEAFNQLGYKLVIAGDGPERARLEEKAGANITFLGQISDAQRTQLMAQSKAVVVAALEDYGLVPIEANVSGTPVIAYGEGGVLDTQVPGKTGLFFDYQTADSLVKTLRQFEQMNWDYAEIRAYALHHFTETIFFDRVKEIIDELCAQPVTHSSHSGMNQGLVQDSFA